MTFGLLHPRVCYYDAIIRGSVKFEVRPIPPGFAVIPYALEFIVDGESPFATYERDVGLTNLGFHTLVGDLVCLLEGGSVPFVLRAVEQDYIFFCVLFMCMDIWTRVHSMSYSAEDLCKSSH